MAKANKKYTVEFYRDMFKLDENNVVVYRLTGKRPRNVRVKSDGYVIINAHYLEHRVVFALYYGYLPDELDHKDRNRSNNDPLNIRECTRSQNLLNTELKEDSTTGLKGVTLRRDGYYQAQCMIDQESTGYIGISKSKEVAAFLYDVKASGAEPEFAYLNSDMGLIGDHFINYIKELNSCGSEPHITVKDVINTFTKDQLYHMATA